MAKTQDERIAKSLDTYRKVARDLGFKPVPNRSDGMLKRKDWTLETNFVHGEGRVLLVQGRTAGDRDSNARRVTLYVRDKVGHADAERDLLSATVNR